MHKSFMRLALYFKFIRVSIAIASEPVRLKIAGCTNLLQLSGGRNVNLVSLLSLMH